MKIFTNEQIKTLTRNGINTGKVTLEELIDNYGRRAAEEIAQRYSSAERIIAFAGPGGNGADTLATCRHLVRMGLSPIVYLFNIGGSSMNDVCHRELEKAIQASVNVTEVVKSFNPPEPDMNPKDLIIDGLFGTGLTAPLQGGFKVVCRQINESGAPIVSIDIPSGVQGDWNARAVNANIVNATLTLVVQFPRMFFYLEENAPLLGVWKVIPTGLPLVGVNNIKAQFYQTDLKDVISLMPKRPEFAQKNTYGHAILYAGSYGMMGAAILAARGALRAGAGKVTVHAPVCGYSVIQSQVPSAMFQRDTGDYAIKDFTLTKNYSSIAIGPGIGTADDTINALESFMKIADANSRALILDADALNCMAKKTTILNHIPVTSILTPHPGEFDLLFGSCATTEQRLRRAIDVARHRQVVIILKGHNTAIIRPDGLIIFNPTGTRALATAGSGDVLTGILAGLMAQGVKSESAAILAVYIHGIAGQIAAQTHGIYGTISTDIADCVGRAITQIMKKSED